MKTRFLIGLIGAATLAVVSGCHHAEPTFAQFPAAPHTAAKSTLQMTVITNRVDPTWLQAPTNLFTLGPGDKLEIELLDETNSITTTIVGPDGKVYFNLLPGLDVWGLTLGQTKMEME